MFIISKFRKKFQAPVKKVLYRTNREITASEVRVIDKDGKSREILSIDEALDLAEESGLDLVEISPESKPPVCKIIDYGKFVYSKKKKDKESLKKQKSSSLKEIKLSPKISEHDTEHKASSAKKFLTDGHKVKVNMRFRGRERAYTDRAVVLMLNFYDKLNEYSEIEQEPKLDNFQMSMILKPKLKKQ